MPACTFYTKILAIAFALSSVLETGVNLGVVFAQVSGQPIGQTVSSAPVLSQEIGNRIQRVEEFRYLKAEAEKLGVRVWLFGGLATGYGHYVRQDLQRQAKLPYHDILDFDYNLASFTTLSQDLDIVVDGTAVQAAELENRLKARFPMEGDGKSLWEVRPLRVSRGPKASLLNNPDFLNQNSDSASTGLIELTDPPSSELRVRDLRAFSTENTPFLDDLSSGRIRFYASSQHRNTELYKQNRNPEIFSVVRYLVKLTRHGLEPSPGDLDALKRIVDRFDPVRDLSNDFAKSRFEKTVEKLITDSTNLEALWKLLDDLGLRSKLLRIGNPTKVRSIAWWLNKKPLLSKPISAHGTGKGRAAKELGLSVVAHETTDFVAYESIQRGAGGHPNAFVSRTENPGESASHGEGFYVAPGEKGRGAAGRESGYTLRFLLDPDAREGVDFLVVGRSKNVDQLVVLNRNALTLIREPLVLNLPQFFAGLAKSGEEVKAQVNGVMDRMERRGFFRKGNVTESDRKAIWTLVQEELKKDELNEQFLREWLRNPASRLDPDLEAAVIDRELSRQVVDPSVVELFRGHMVPEKARTILNQALRQGDDFYLRRLIEVYFPSALKGDWPGRARFLDAALARIDSSRAYWTINAMLVAMGEADWTLPGMVADGEWLIRRYARSHFAAARLLTDPVWAKHPRGGDFLMEQVWINLHEPKTDKKDRSHSLFRKNKIAEPDRGAYIIEALSKPEWRAHPRWAEAIEVFLSKNDYGQDYEFVSGLLEHGDPVQEPRLVGFLKTLLRRYQGQRYSEIPAVVLSEPAWYRSPAIYDLVEIVSKMSQETVDSALETILPNLNPDDPRSVKLLNACLSKVRSRERFIKGFLSRPDWWKVPRVQIEVRKLMERSLDDPAVWDAIAKMGKHPFGTELLEAAIAEQHGFLAKTGLELFKGREWAENPRGLELLEKVIRKNTTISDEDAAVLTLTHWRDHPKLRALCKGEEPSFLEIKKAFALGRTLVQEKPSVQDQYCSLKGYLKALVQEKVVFW